MEGDDVAELVQNMTDREILVLVAEKVERIEEHGRETNGQIAELKIAHYEQKGALGMLRLMMTVAVAGIGAGGTVAGIVLAIVARGT